MSEGSVSYSCKILPYGTWPSIIIATNISITIIFLGTLLHFPVVVNMILLLAVMFFIFYHISDRATFTISPQSLSRSLDKKPFLFRNTADKQYSWNDVLNFKNGVDRGRYRGEYNYLEIRFRSGDTWVVTDMYKEREREFIVFRDAFLEQVHRYNDAKKATMPVIAPPLSTGPVFSSTSRETPVPHLIIQKKTIYESIWGKIFTVLLGFAIVGFLVYGQTYMSTTSQIKLHFVLIPGFVYMFYRTFIKNK